MKPIDEVLLSSPYFISLRHDFHAHPELGLNEFRTSRIIAEELTKMGYSVTRNIAKTGLVATLKRGESERSIGIRAEMDALPIKEKSELPYRSKHDGIMHACGHDGHVATLLCAAHALATRKKFDGTVHLIFQPAEENAGGAQLMVQEGLFKDFPCDFVFAMHNDPLLPFGKLAWRYGPIMAAVDSVKVLIKGRGGHEGMPHLAADPIIAGSAIIMALQTIVSRNIDPCDPAILSIGSFHSGTTSGIIPEEAEIEIGLRSVSDKTRNQLEERLKFLIHNQATSFGVDAEVDVERWYGPTVNNDKAVDTLVNVAKVLFGDENLIELEKSFMLAEDFSYMLNTCRGAYFFIGGATGEGDYPLHHPSYNFNDNIVELGAMLWTNLVESYLKMP
ncbi:amidohydrolase [Brucella sp. BO3]|uniref:M20 aminoacylase family protein n=1 Tax=unclassified Brucella TaxID=2632610 RepID=UPI00084FA0A1|nr:MULTISPECIES: M20 aminoacylase family protein [unclassified Brucella]OEI82844.1 amidohydrolase [Brucella sp. B13-0095]QMV27782.1 amidohydrolase [Brucella sp. BO3]UWF60309.1 M20 family metallopeptidase [Brucella sp. 2716]